MVNDAGFAGTGGS